MATEIVMPALGLTVEKGSVLRWLKEEGDPVKKGEPLIEVEADKVTTEVESPATGVLRKILVPEGVEVPILTVIGLIAPEEEDLPQTYTAERSSSTETPVGGAVGPETDVIERASSEQHRAATQPGIAKAVPAARRVAREYGIDLSPIVGSGPGGTILRKDVENHMTLSVVKVSEPRGDTMRATPLARKLAEKEGIDLAGISGTGPQGRIVKMDVVRAADRNADGGLPEGKAEGLLGKTIPMNRMRQVIARRMAESAFTAPHIYFFADVDMGKVLDLRQEILPEFEAQFKVRISINDFILKAVGLTVRDYPMLNASVEGDRVHIHPDINVGLAVALDEGLIVPAICNTDRCGLGHIALKRLDLVERARAGKLNMEEIERGTFTVSSLAQFDITFFTAILNPPQSGILSIGRVDEKLRLVQGEVSVQRVSVFGLSVDHRIIDGAVAAAFLQALKKRLENPSFAFLQI
jgi:pyruvate dehydrogenase E2 component (dihydrolipoamide acetyltransferase)